MIEQVSSSDLPPVQSKMHIAEVEEPRDIISEHLTRDDQIGLGRWAVQSDMLRTQKAIESDEMPSMGKQIDNLDIPFEIRSVRKKLNKLSLDQMKHITDQLEGTFIGHQLLDSDDERPAEEQLRARIRARKNGEYVVSNETVLNFLQWYMDRTLDMQKTLDNEIGERKAEYKDRIQQAVDVGWIPARVLANLRFIDATDVLYDDMFNTEVKGLAGYYSPRNYRQTESPTVALSPMDYLQNTEEETLTHEFNHALSRDNDEKYNRTVQLKGVFGKFGALVFDEAFTEHLAQSLVHGNFDNINPYNREKDARTARGAYRDYRVFLNAIVHFGTEQINIRELYDVLYFSRQDTKLSESEGVRHLHAKLLRAFPGIDIVGELRNMTKAKQLDALTDKLYEFQPAYQSTKEELQYEALRSAYEANRDEIDATYYSNNRPD